MSAQNHTRLFRWLIRHYVVTYFLMVTLFLLFGLISLDLIKYVSANANYILENGLQGLWDGGLQQFIELLLASFCAVLAYVGFKLCEHALVQRAAHRYD